MKRFTVSKIFSVAIVILLFISGCAQFKVKRFVQDNTFYSSHLPKIELKISDEMKYIGKVEYSKVGTFKGESIEGPITSHSSYIFGKIKNGIIDKAINIRFAEINRGYWLPDMFEKIKHKLDHGVENFHDENYQFVITAATRPFNKEQINFLRDKGYIVSNCNISKAYGNIFGADQRNRVFLIYSENLYYDKNLPYRCDEWRDKDFLTDTQKVFINEFNSRFNKSFNIEDERNVTKVVTVPKLAHSDLLPAQQKSFNKYMDPVKNPHLKAFAVEINGDRAGWSHGYRKPENAIETAIQSCSRKGASCQLYAVGDRVVLNYNKMQLDRYLREYYEEVFPPGDLRKIVQQALKGEEIKAIIEGREGERYNPRTGTQFTIKFMSSGDLVVNIIKSKMSIRTGKYKGKWWIEGDRWCRRIENMFSGRSECQYVLKEDNGLAFYNEDGAFINRVRFKP